jgi:hypothetical protein
MAKFDRTKRENIWDWITGWFYPAREPVVYEYSSSFSFHNPLGVHENKRFQPPLKL